MSHLAWSFRLAITLTTTIAFCAQAIAGGSLLEKKGLEKTSLLLTELAIEQFSQRLVRGIELKEALTDIEKVAALEAAQLRKFLDKKGISEAAVLKIRSMVRTRAGLEIVMRNGRKVLLSRTNETGVILLNDKKIVLGSRAPKPLPEQVAQALRETHVAESASSYDSRFAVLFASIVPKADAIFVETLLPIAAGVALIVGIIAIVGVLGWHAYDQIASAIQGTLPKRIAGLTAQCEKDRGSGTPFENSETYLTLQKISQANATTVFPEGSTCEQIVAELRKTDRRPAQNFPTEVVLQMCRDADQLARCIADYKKASETSAGALASGLKPARH